MKIRELMSSPVVRIHPGENILVASRMMERCNVGAIPVCGNDGRLQGMITDRDIVTRCLAAERSPATTKVGDIMTAGVVAIRPDMDVSTAAALMGNRQVRRLPVMENGKLCGMISLGDLSLKEESNMEAGDALTEISAHLSSRL